MMKKLALAVFLVYMSVCCTMGQRIIGFFPNYSYSSGYQNIQYQKLTHLYYFSLNPKRSTTGKTNGSLWTVNDPYSWFSATRFSNVVTKARAVNPQIKIFITTGGSPGNDSDLNQRLIFIAQNEDTLNTFCNNVIGFIKSNNLDGWDLDWEFPMTTEAKDAHEKLISKMRDKIDSVNTADSKNLEITIDVGGGYVDPACWAQVHTNYVNNNVINLVDYVNMMAYDGPVGTGNCKFSSHEHYDLASKAIEKWAAKGWSKSKLVLGVAFKNNSGTAFSAGGNNSNYYNQEYYNVGGSGCPNMKAKWDLAKGQGLGGIFIWELMQDNLCTGTMPACYSLLDCIYSYANNIATAVNESKDKSGLTLYPNPSSHSFRLTSALPQNGPVHVKIYNALGTEAESYTFETFHDGVELGGSLPKGLYLIEILHSGKSERLSLVKE